VSFISDIGSFIMEPLYFVISSVLVAFHTVFGKVFGDASGASWALSIIGLTLVIRALLIPLFVKQIKSSRNMQLLQPKVKELQKKYGHDRERLAQETMNLYRETKTNPFSACLPLVVQMPIFIALFRLLDQAAKGGTSHGVLTATQANQLAHAQLFGAPLSATFTKSGGEAIVQVIAMTLVVCMIATTFLTQRQLMSKNMPADALSGPYAQQQKMLLYVLPFVMGISGFFFPIGVLLYWTTSNLWTMGQQFYVIRNNPAPNTQAFRAKVHRDEEKRKRKGLPPVDKSGSDTITEAPPEPPRPAQRQQPKKLTREQRRKLGSKPAEVATPADTTPQDDPPQDDPPADDPPNDSQKRRRRNK
jgi:YidC/Oxa1 family membrane protein insertase